MSTRISKKTAKEIAYRVNSICCWQSTIIRKVEKSEPCRQEMRWHDESVDELAAILGIQPTTKYSN